MATIKNQREWKIICVGKPAAIPDANMGRQFPMGRCHTTDPALYRARWGDPLEVNIEGLRLVVPPFITLVSITSDVYDMGKVHQEMLERGWGHMYGTHHGIEYIRLSVHQSRDMEHARQFLRALEDSVDAVRAQT